MALISSHMFAQNFCPVTPRHRQPRSKTCTIFPNPSTLSTKSHSSIQMKEKSTRMATPFDFSAWSAAAVLIKCHLFKTFLRSSGHGVEYEALSYTWGNPRKTRTISVDGKQFKVTENLFEVLHYLRSDQKDRISFWGSSS